MNPGYPTTSGAHPDWISAQSRFKTHCDGFPKPVNLRHRCSTHKCSQVTVCRIGSPGRGHDEIRVAAQIRETDYTVTSGYGIEVAGERYRVRLRVEPGTVEQYEFEGLANGVHRYMGCFPTISWKRRIRQQRDEK